MAYFNKNKGGGKFGKKHFGGRDSRPQMFDAICSNCGKECQVPFRPTGERPVYCRECFDKERDFAPREKRGSDFSRDRFQDRGPSRKTFDELPHTASAGNNNFKQLERLEGKLDKIISLLTAANAPKELVAPAPKKEAVPPVSETPKQAKPAKKPAKKAAAPKKAKKK